MLQLMQQSADASKWATSHIHWGSRSVCKVTQDAAFLQFHCDPVPGPTQNLCRSQTHTESFEMQSAVNSLHATSPSDLSEHDVCCSDASVQWIFPFLM